MFQGKTLRVTVLILIIILQQSIYWMKTDWPSWIKSHRTALSDTSTTSQHSTRWFSDFEHEKLLKKDRQTRCKYCKFPKAYGQTGTLGIQSRCFSTHQDLSSTIWNLCEILLCKIIKSSCFVWSFKGNLGVLLIKLLPKTPKPSRTLGF